jgi:acyl carrier protein
VENGAGPDRAVITEKVTQIFYQLFSAKSGSITLESSPDTVDGWDSLQHLNLILALEEEFGISLTEAQMIEMLSVGLIVEILAESIGAKS